MANNSVRPRFTRAAVGAIALTCTGLTLVVPSDAAASESRPTATHNVAFTKGRFIPDNIGIDLGDKIRWVNTDATEIHIESVRGPRKFTMATRETLSRGESWKIPFNREGTYIYRDSISGQRGEIRVGPDEHTAVPKGNGYGHGPLLPPNPN